MQASLVPSLLFPDTERSAGSSPHPSPLCSQNTQPTTSHLSPSTAPARTYTSPASLCLYSVSSSAPPSLCCTSAENLPRCAHGPVGHFARCTRSRDDTSESHPTLSSDTHPPRLPAPRTDTAGSTQCDTCTHKHSGLVFLSPSTAYTIFLQRRLRSPIQPRTYVRGSAKVY